MSLSKKIKKFHEKAEIEFAKLEGRSTAKDPVVRAYNDVLGRDPENQAAIDNWARVGGYDDIVKLMSLEPEARARGVDPIQYGNTVVDPETLSEVDQEWYEEWSRHNSGPFFSGHQELLGFHQDFGSLETYRAQNEGLIQREGDQVIVTQEAIDRYGTDLVFSGTEAGVVVLTPTGSDVDIKHSTDELGKDSEEYVDYWGERGYQVHATTGSPSKGLIRGKVGEFVGKAVPKEFHFATDPLGLATGPLWGQKVDERARTSLEPVGVSSRNVTRFQHAAREVSQVALMAAGPLGWAAAGGMELAGAEANRARYGGSRSDWMQRGAEQYGVRAIGSVAGPFGQIGAQLALDYSKGGERRADMFENAAWTVANRYTGGAAAFGRAAMDDSYSVDDAAFAFAQAAGYSLTTGGGESRFSWEGDEGVFSNIGSNVGAVGSGLWDAGTRNIRADFQDPQTGEWSFVPDGSKTNPFSSDTYSGDAVAGRLGLVRGSDGVDWGKSTRQGAGKVSRILGAPYAPHRWAWDGAVDWATDTDRPWRRSPPADDTSFVPGGVEERIFV